MKCTSYDVLLRYVTSFFFFSFSFHFLTPGSKYFHRPVFRHLNLMFFSQDERTRFRVVQTTDKITVPYILIMFLYNAVEDQFLN